MIDPTTYLYLVLLPVADAFRSDLKGKERAMTAIKHPKSCRIKFMNKKVEAKWAEFCNENELKNDTTING